MRGVGEEGGGGGFGDVGKADIQKENCSWRKMKGNHPMENCGRPWAFFPTLQSGVVRICVKSASHPASPPPPPHPSFLTHVLPRPCQKMSGAQHDCKRQQQNVK